MQRDSSVFGKLPLGTKLKVGKLGQVIPQDAPETPTTETCFSTQSSSERVGLSTTAQKAPKEGVSLASFIDYVRFPTPRDDSDVSQSQVPRVSPDGDAPPPIPPKPAHPVGYQPLASGNSLRRPPNKRKTRPSYVMVPEEQELLEGHQPAIRPASGMSPADLEIHYQDIKRYRRMLIDINEEIAELQARVYEGMAEGKEVVGMIVIGSGLKFKHGKKLLGTSREAVIWSRLQHANGSRLGYWVLSENCNLPLSASNLQEKLRYLQEYPP